MRESLTCFLNTLQVATRVMAATHIDLMSCPDDVLISIIYASREGAARSNMTTLRSLQAVNMRLRELMTRHKQDIIRHYTIAFYGAAGYVSHYYCGMLHCEDDMPARILSSGDKLWYCFGRLHRGDDKPAIVRICGARMWYRWGRCHRDGDQPAHITGEGDQCWYRNDYIYREGGLPAIIYADGRCAVHGPNILPP